MQLGVTERKWQLSADGFFDVDNSVLCRVSLLKMTTSSENCSTVLYATMQNYFTFGGVIADVRIPPYIRDISAPSHKRHAVNYQWAELQLCAVRHAEVSSYCI